MLQIWQVLKVTINQLREEVDEKESSVKLQQLQKQNKELQQQLLKHKELKHVESGLAHVETISTSTQTDEVC